MTEVRGIQQGKLLLLMKLLKRSNARLSHSTVSCKTLWHITPQEDQVDEERVEKVMLWMWAESIAIWSAMC